MSAPDMTAIARCSPCPPSSRSFRRSTDFDVIDLGFGEGHNTRALARRGARLTGVDIAERMIAAARSAESEEPLGIAYRVDLFTRLDGIDDQSFDAAVSTMALTDSPGLAHAARAAFRVLRPGGGLYFSVLHPCFNTPGLGWCRDESGWETHLLVADYFSDQSYIERWRFSKAPEATRAELFCVPRFGLRLEDYAMRCAAPDSNHAHRGAATDRPTEREASLAGSLATACSPRAVRSCEEGLSPRSR